MIGGYATANLDSIAQHWRTDGADTFPLLLTAAKDWTRPFCFRCGWHAPQPESIGPRARLWNVASGWLERAHLHDRVTGGPGTADNLVPLCGLCHRYMPEFPDSREPAIAWVRAQEHSGCPRWWQRKTNELFNGDGFIRNPGSTHLTGTFVKAVYRSDRMDVAVRAAEDGDRVGALRLLRLLGVAQEDAEVAVTFYGPEPEMVAAA